MRRVFTGRTRPGRRFSTVIMTLLALHGTAPALASGNVDPVTTGSIHPQPATLRPANDSGSPQFHSALALLDRDKPAAYRMARGISDPIERRVIQWAAIYYGGGKIDYQSVLRFEKDAPEYASRALYKTRMEQALTGASVLPGSDEIIRLLGGAMPNTLDAQIALAAAYVTDGQTARAGRIIKQIWIDDFLSADREKAIMGRFGSLLDQADYWKRAVHLLMHDRARGTERILAHLTPAQKSLARARIAVSRRQKDASTLLARVDPQYRDAPLFYFSLAQKARRDGHLAHAVSYLDQVKGDAPDSAEFWYERRLIVRQALAAGDYKIAYRAAAGYEHGPEGRLVDARFHAGWIALEYLKAPELAEKHFVRMRELSTLPDSISQSHYWLGRALKAQGKTAEAQAAFKVAAKYNLVYYGQLSRLQLGITTIGLRDLPAWHNSEAIFNKRELVRAVRLLDANGRDNLAEPLVRRLAYQVTDPGEMLLAARLAQTIDAHNVAILIADIASKRGIPLDLFNFPKDGLPANAQLAEIDKAAVYAVARQESRFDPQAVSRSGARGLMQLMPATAKEVAGKVGLAYSASRLTSDPAYNARLGSTYLAAQLDRYDGSLVLAAAAYNAGAGNVNKWIKTFGDPRLTTIDAVNWIEAIPFAETRKYVQRVLGNYMVYRARLGDRSMTIAQALRKIPH